MTHPFDPITRLIDILPDAVIVTQATGRIVLANHGVKEVLGYEPVWLVGKSLGMLVQEKMRQRHDAMVASFAANGNAKLMAMRPVLHAVHRSGASVPVSISLNRLDIDGVWFCVAVIRDARCVHEQLAKAIAVAETDALTGIGNRLCLSRGISRRIQASRSFALLYFDLTKFKPFNDLYGHHVGDEVLRIIARRCVAMVRENDLAVRIGGDEFVLLIDGLADAALLRTRASSVSMSLRRPFLVGDLRGSIGLHIGGALYPSDAPHEAGLLAFADANMYRAKRTSSAV